MMIVACNLHSFSPSVLYDSKEAGQVLCMLIIQLSTGLVSWKKTHQTAMFSRVRAQDKQVWIMLVPYEVSMLCLSLITPLLLLRKRKTLSLNNHNCTDFLPLQGSLEPALIFLGNPLAQFSFPSVNRSFAYSNSYSHMHSLSLFLCWHPLSTVNSAPAAQIQGCTMLGFVSELSQGRTH